jgi:hypothetical protein
MHHRDSDILLSNDSFDFLLKHEVLSLLRNKMNWSISKEHIAFLIKLVIFNSCEISISNSIVFKMGSVKVIHFFPFLEES